MYNFLHTALHVVQCQQQGGKHGTSHLRENQTYNAQTYQHSGNIEPSEITAWLIRKYMKWQHSRGKTLSLYLNTQVIMQYTSHLHDQLQMKVISASSFPVVAST